MQSTTTSDQRCSRDSTVEVGSDRDQRIRYTVAFGPVGTSCTCPGFVHHGRCKHLVRGEAVRCGWTSADGEPQDRRGACPRCGAATVSGQAATGDASELHITIRIIGLP